MEVRKKVSSIFFNTPLRARPVQAAFANAESPGTSNIKLWIGTVITYPDGLVKLWIGIVITNPDGVVTISL